MDYITFFAYFCILAFFVSFGFATLAFIADYGAYVLSSVKYYAVKFIRVICTLIKNELNERKKDKVIRVSRTEKGGEKHCSQKMKKAS